jgi:hypothetical protein
VDGQPTVQVVPLRLKMMGFSLLFAGLPMKPIEVSPPTGMGAVVRHVGGGHRVAVLLPPLHVSTMKRFIALLRIGYDSVRVHVKMMVDVIAALDRAGLRRARHDDRPQWSH